MRLDGACGCAGSRAMADIWGAAAAGDVGEVQRLVGQDPGRLDARDGGGMTPLTLASREGHTGMVRWLVDNGAAINERTAGGLTALYYACFDGHAPVVKLLLERGADPTISTRGGMTPLVAASFGGHLEVVRLLLGLPSGQITVNHRNDHGQTALWWACYNGHGGVVRLLLESGADPPLETSSGTTPVAIAKEDNAARLAEGRRECLAALEVSFRLPLSSSLSPGC
jgi:ankyrin repeat protein